MKCPWKGKTQSWNFTAGVSVVQLSVLWANRADLRLWFRFIALPSPHNSTQIPLAEWSHHDCRPVSLFMRALQVSPLVPEMWPQPWSLETFWWKAVLLASGLHSLPSVALAGTWTYRWLWPLFQDIKPGQELGSCFPHQIFYFKYDHNNRCLMHLFLMH